MPYSFWHPNIHFKVGQANPKDDVTRSRMGLRFRTLDFCPCCVTFFKKSLYLLTYLFNKIFEYLLQIRLLARPWGYMALGFACLICKCCSEVPAVSYHCTDRWHRQWCGQTLKTMMLCLSDKAAQKEQQREGSLASLVCIFAEGNSTPLKASLPWKVPWK